MKPNSHNYFKFVYYVILTCVYLFSVVDFLDFHCLVECLFLLCVVWILESVCFNHHCTFPPFHFLSASFLFPFFLLLEKDRVPPLFQWAMLLVNVLTVEEESYWISHSGCEINLALVSWSAQMLQSFPLLLLFTFLIKPRKLHTQKPEIQNHKGWINMTAQINWMITQFLI